MSPTTVVSSAYFMMWFELNLAQRLWVILALADLRATILLGLKAAFRAVNIAHTRTAFLVGTCSDVLSDTDIIYTLAHVSGHRLSILP